MPLPHPQLHTARTILVIAIVFAAALAAACNSDGDRIVFTSDRDGNLEIYSISTSGGDEMNLTQSGADEFSPKLSPNGKAVAFISDRAGKAALETAGLDGDGRVEVANGDALSDHHWSPDSERIAFLSERGGQWGVMTAKADGSLSVPVAGVAGDEVGDWSKDGQLIAVAVRDGDGRGLYLRNPDGVNEFRLTDGADSSPRWSPTSDHIAFVSDRDGYSDLYVMEVVDGSRANVVRITRTESAEYDIAWSPNGRLIAFVSEHEGNAEIYLASADGESVTRLTFNDAVDEQPAWSASGKKIAFVSYLDGDGEIFVMDPDGGNQTRLTRNESNDAQPSW